MCVYLCGYVYVYIISHACILPAYVLIHIDTTLAHAGGYVFIINIIPIHVLALTVGVRFN